MAESGHTNDGDLRRLHEAAADALMQRYEEKIAIYRDLYRKTMADAFESILEVEIARRMDEATLVSESKAQAIANLEEAETAKEKYEDYERRLAALETLLDEEDGLDGAFARYIRTDEITDPSKT
jgi:lantibiotic modifying enzyme